MQDDESQPRIIMIQDTNKRGEDWFFHSGMQKLDFEVQKVDL